MYLVVIGGRFEEAKFSPMGEIADEGRVGKLANFVRANLASNPLSALPMRWLASAYRR